MGPAGATGGNRWQMPQLRKRLNQADRQRVATHGNRFGAHGKEGVDGSSPSEGFEKMAAQVLDHVHVRGKKRLDGVAELLGDLRGIASFREEQARERVT
jgi:hypothetical protein